MCQGLNSHYFHIIGDGHQPNSRGLYTHYKDSVIKGGITIPNIATWSTEKKWKAPKTFEAHTFLSIRYGETRKQAIGFSSLGSEIGFVKSNQECG